MQFVASFTQTTVFLRFAFVKIFTPSGALHRDGCKTNSHSIFIIKEMVSKVNTQILKVATIFSLLLNVLLYVCLFCGDFQK